MLAQIVLFDGFDPLDITTDGGEMTGRAAAARLPVSRGREHRIAADSSGAGA
ncbi:hypothetical protein ACNTMW_24145 [Planosporangium sp. 12N6]|uniref:hypothetical protein n=1 Tax=Planosporangium spinosum TaxID=3402278 RepID=UPI003CF5780D